MKQNLVTLSRVSQFAESGKEILHNISLSVSAGETLGILGASGAGKSSLLSLFSGLDYPSSGKVERNLAQGETSFVFQEPALMPWANVQENIALPLKLIGAPSAEILERTSSLLVLMHLQECAHLRPHELSGGMKMRVSLARALASQPRLLLLDEPFAALDQLLTEHLSYELLEISLTWNLTTVFVTHNIAEAVFLCDRICLLAPNPGRVISEVNLGGKDHRKKVHQDALKYRESHDFFEKCNIIRRALEDINALT